MATRTNKLCILIQSGSVGPPEQLWVQSTVRSVFKKMSIFFNIAVIFAAAAAVLFTPSTAAPISGDLTILPYPYYAGQIQQDSVPDPGIGDWFTNIFNSISKMIANGLKERDPKKIEEVKAYIKKYRTFVAPIASFVRKNYPDDVAARNILNAIDAFLSSLDKQVQEPSTSNKDMESLTKLVRMLEVVTS